MSKRDTFYFPHEYNAKDDPKCERLICEMGMEGYGIFWALLEVLRVQPDYKYPLSNVHIIAHKYYTTEEQVQRVIFDFGLFTIVDDSIFFSSGLITRMRPLDEARKTARESGKKGAEKRWGNRVENRDPNRVAMATPLAPLIASKVNKSKENIGGAGGKRTTFSPPSISEISEYIRSKNYSVDAAGFHDFYESKGWMVGKNKMKDWKAAVRTWEGKNNTARPQQTPTDVLPV